MSVFPYIREISIGHNRYGTTGESALKNVQPLFSELSIGGIAIALIMEILTNTHHLKDQLIKSGSIFQSTSDTEVILHYYQQQMELY